MKLNNSDPKSAATVSTVLRIGLGIVFIVFGTWKAITPVAWVIFLPNWVSDAVENIEALNALGALRMMGFVEAVLGLQMFLGLFTKATAVICTFMLAGIIFHVGFDQVGVRDAGLLFAALALSFAGGGPWSLDHWLNSETETESLT